jgi:hypothetical protein
MHASERTQTPQLFRKMSRAIRLMAGMQLLPAEFARVLNPPRRTQASIVFYLGCNALRTPHLLFNAMYVLDALGTDYEVVGGPGSCCGIVQSKWEGELGRGERMINATLTRFEGLSPEKVLSWCPSCNLHIGETLAGFHSTSFSPIISTSCAESSSALCLLRRCCTRTWDWLIWAAMWRACLGRFRGSSWSIRWRSRATPAAVQDARARRS